MVDTHYSMTEGRLTFTFPRNSQATKYDEWSFYRNQFKGAFGGAKAVDFIHSDGNVAWLIEVKDYRIYRRNKSQKIWEEFAFKVRDTLAGLASAKWNANNPDEKQIAENILGCRRIRVVLHLEQPRQQSRLFPTAFNPSIVQQKLKQLLKPVDAHPLVIDKNHLTRFNWSVTSN